MSKLLSATILTLLALAPSAAAQPDDSEEAPAEKSTSADSDDDALDFGDSSGSQVGADENPGDPQSVFAEQNKPEDTSKKEASQAQTGYPQRIIDRPINLPAGMSEITLAIPTYFDAKSISANARAAYAATRDVQLGLHYGFGTLTDGDFAVGKAIAAEGQYLLTNWLGISLSVPLYLDPFAVGVVAGAPMWFTFFEKFSIRVGEELLRFRLHRFFPSVTNASVNETLIAADKDNQLVPYFYFNLGGRFIYQIDDRMALDAHFGAVFNDLDEDTPVPLDFGFSYSPSNKLDFGGRLGWLRLDEPSKSFGATVFAALRI